MSRDGSRPDTLTVSCAISEQSIPCVGTALQCQQGERHAAARCSLLTLPKLRALRAAHSLSEETPSLSAKGQYLGEPPKQQLRRWAIPVQEDLGGKSDSHLQHAEQADR